MKTILINLYDFPELAADVQEKVLHNLRLINVETGRWWESIYADADRIGLTITSFDLDDSRHALGKFKLEGKEVADKILTAYAMDEHAYKLAATFKAERSRLGKAILAAKADELQGLQDEFDVLHEQFEKDLLEAYSKILQSELNYLMSDECIKETIEANGYTFNSAGKMINGVAAEVHVLFDKSKAVCGVFSSNEIAVKTVTDSLEGGDWEVVGMKLNELKAQ